MKVFISQSKPRSLALAQALEPFIRKVIPGTNPWVSDSPVTGIEKGSRFMSEIRDNLTEASAGVVCMTRENLLEPWILYESGALSTKAADRVWTVLLDVAHTDVADPLKVLNHTKAEEADMLKMVTSIHKTVVAAKVQTCSDADLKDYFKMFWPQVEQKIAELRAQDPAPVAPPDPQKEMLGLLRAILQRVTADEWREEKILSMLHVVYATTVGSVAPGLETLRQIVSTLHAPASIRALDDAASKMGWQPQYAGTPLPMRAPQRQQPSTMTIDPMTAPAVVKSESEK